VRVHNSDVVKIFYEVAELLEIQDENQFRMRAYREGSES
jgi:DNA polymerase (family 10)